MTNAAVLFEPDVEGMTAWRRAIHRHPELGFEELSATAEEMNSQAEQLQRLVAQFRLDLQAQQAGGDGGAPRAARAHAAPARATREPRRIGLGNPQPAFAAAADPEYVRF